MRKFHNVRESASMNVRGFDNGKIHFIFTAQKMLFIDTITAITPLCCLHNHVHVDGQTV